MAEDTKKTGKGKKERKVTARQYLLEAGYAMELLNSDPSLQEFVGRLKTYMSENKGRTPTDRELDDMKQGIDWFERYNADQELARRQQADPRFRADWERSIELAEQNVRALAANYGVELTPDEIRTLATDVRLNKLTDVEVRERFAPILERALAQGADLSGRAAEIEREILQWSQRNGLRLTGQTIARYVQAGIEGRSTLDDIKNDLRRTYLAGQYPAWSDKINEGSDPADLFEPYRQTASNLLELPEISFDDPILKRASQAIGDDGKPIQMPLYQFEQEIRKDPRWQQTNNAMEAYNRLADQILSMFGLG